MVLDPTGRIPVVEAPQGVFLPGGGSIPREAAAREVAEEAALVVKVGARLGVATEYVRAGPELAHDLAKESTFFLAVVMGETTAAQHDHILHWLDPSDVPARLTYESHAWAVARAHAWP